MQWLLSGRWMKSLLICTLFIQVWLVVLHLRLAGHDDPKVQIVGQAFSLTREASIPNMFNSIQALAAAFFAGCLAAVSRKFRSRKGMFSWGLLMVIFSVIAIDDGAAIHERLNSVASVHIAESIGYPSYPWHLIVAPWLAIPLLIGIWLAIREASSRGVTTLLVLAVLCFGSAQLLDFLEGWEVMSRVDPAKVAPILEPAMIVEELLELVGTALFAYAFLSILVNRLRTELGLDSDRGMEADPASSHE